MFLTRFLFFVSGLVLLSIIVFLGTALVCLFFPVPQVVFDNIWEFVRYAIPAWILLVLLGILSVRDN